jgi:hypothetical protein
VAPKTNVFRGKHFADPTIKKSKIWLPNLKYQLKNKYPPLAKNVTKGLFSCHICPLPLLWHEFDNGLWNFLQSKVACYLHMYFLWRHHLSRSQQIGKWSRYWLWLIYILYWHIYDCWHCFLVSNISVSHALEMTINFYYPTLELFSFSFTQPFTYSKFRLPNPFLFGATPAINNDRSLR